MSTAVERCLTDRFLNHFGAPDVLDPKAYEAEYERALAGTAEDILFEAGSLVIKRHKFRNWPTVGECAAAVEQIAEERSAAKTRAANNAKPAAPTWQEPTAEMKARVDALMRETIVKLKSMRPKPVKTAPLPDVSRDAWETRFGQAPRQKPVYPTSDDMPRDKSGRPDVSHQAWHARYGYKAGEIDRRLPGEKEGD